MTIYYVVVYKKPLTDHEIETISSLCGDIKIELVYEREDNNILSLIETMFDTAIHGCYRLLAEEIPETAILGTRLPLYIGRIDPEFEAFYEKAMTLYIRSLDLLSAMDEFISRSDVQILEFNECFDRPSEMDVPPLGELEDQVLADMGYIKAALAEKLEQNRFK